jgi:hypothetical protein
MQGRPITPSGQTAATLILIGLVLQAIEVAILLFIGLLLLFFPIVAFFVIAFGAIGVAWVALVWGFSYTPTKEGNYGGARTATLVFGILSLLTLGVISGILYIIAYVKLGDAEREANPAPAGWGSVPYSPNVRYCSTCGRPNTALGAFCPYCGARSA